MSRIIKSPWVKAEATEGKVIGIKTLTSFHPTTTEEEVQQIIDHQTEIDELYAKANSDALQIVELAKEQAQQMKESLEAERQQWYEVDRKTLEEESRSIGFNEGLVMGKQQGYEEMHEQIQDAKHIVELSKADYQNYVESSETTILQLATKIAEKIINYELTTNDDAFLSIVKKVMKEAREYREVRLLVHPSKYEFVLVQKAELLGIFPKETDFYIYPDEEINETSCIIESSNGRIDASVDSQLKEVKQKLLEILKGE